MAVRRLWLDNRMRGASYIKLPQELRNSKKGLINIKNNDNECFVWCHIRHLHSRDSNPQRIKKTDKAFINEIDYSDIEFPVSVKQYNKVEKNININVFCLKVYSTNTRLMHGY